MSDRDSDARAVLGIVIVTYNAALELTDAVSPWATAGVEGYQTVLVDNASTDGTCEVGAGLGCHVIANQANVGFARAANQGIAHFLEQPVPPEWIMVLNPDTREAPGFGVRETIDQLALTPDSYSYVIPKIRLPDGRDIPNTRRYPSIRNLLIWAVLPDWLSQPTSSPYRINQNYMVGSILLCRTELWDCIGGFDPGYTLYGEDAALSKRLSRSHVEGRELSIPILHEGNKPLVELPRLQQYLYIRNIKRFNEKQFGQFHGQFALICLTIGFSARTLKAMTGRNAALVRTYRHLASACLRMIRDPNLGDRLPQ